MVAVAAAVVLAPWTIYASREEGRFIPVTKGSAAALFVGTYLPGGGTTIGMKEHLETAVARARTPSTTAIKTYKIPAADALELFAAKHPELPRDQALSKEAKKNLIHYSTTQPVAFAQHAVGQGQADVVLLLPRRRRALHLDADADLAGRSSSWPAARACWPG